MKQKDIMLIVVIVIVAGTFSLMFSNLIIKPRIKRDKVEVVQKIEPSLPAINSDGYKKFFNSGALNPTQQIKIGDQQNQNPFNGSSQ